MHTDRSACLLQRRQLPELYRPHATPQCPSAHQRAQRWPCRRLHGHLQSSWPSAYHSPTAHTPGHLALTSHLASQQALPLRRRRWERRVRIVRVDARISRWFIATANRHGLRGLGVVGLDRFLIQPIGSVVHGLSLPELPASNRGASRRARGFMCLDYP